MKTNELTEALKQKMREEYESGYHDCYVTHKGFMWNKFPEHDPANRVPILIAYSVAGHDYTTIAEWHRALHEFFDFKFRDFIPNNQVKAWAELPKYK